MGWLVGAAVLALGGMIYIYYADVWGQPVCYNGQ